MTESGIKITEEKVRVSYKALKELIDAFEGPSYLLMELRVLSSLPDSPINVLKEQMRQHLEDKNLG